jgi:hypothetical protein
LPWIQRWHRSRRQRDAEGVAARATHEKNRPDKDTQRKQRHSSQFSQGFSN